MAKFDGSVLIDTRIDTGGFEKGASNLKGQFSALGSSVKALGGAISAAFSVKVISDFAKEAIELGSNLQEVQNVVDVTFTTMNKQVNEFAKNAASTAGLSETMAKKYTGTFGSMAKSFGFTEQEAYDLSTALTQMTGDVASFYNLTQDVAYTKLKSVFTGETEALKDLGVVMTQTALDDYALRKGFGKTTSKMTEQEKVALRYRFVMEQLAGASGDFVRTQDGWANQTRVLSLQMEQFKATVGQGLINILTPVIKILNTLIGKLQEFAQIFKDVTDVIFGVENEAPSGAGIAETLGDAAGKAEDLGENIEEAGKEAKKAFAGFDEINVLTLSVAENAESLEESISENASIDLGEAEMPVSVDGNDKVSPVVYGIAEKLKEYFGELKEMFLPFTEINFSALGESFAKLKDVFFSLQNMRAENTKWIWTDVFVPAVEWIVEEGGPVLIDILSDTYKILGRIESVCYPIIKALWDGFLKPLAKWKASELLYGLKNLSKILSSIADLFKGYTPELYEFSDAEKEIIAESKDAYNSFKKLQNQSKKTTQSIKTQWKRTEDLADELLRTADESGRVKEADQARVEFILGELSKATGQEYEMVGGVIQQYDKLKDEIYEIIKAKKANALLDANKETYESALLGKDKAYAAAKVKEKAFLENKKKLEEAKKERDRLQNSLWDGSYADGLDWIAIDAERDSIEGSITEYGIIINAYEKEIRESEQDWLEAKAEYEEMRDAVSDYEQASAAIITGDVDKAIRILSAYSINYATAATGEVKNTVEAMKDAARAAGLYAMMIEEEFEAGYGLHTEETVQSAVTAFEEALGALADVDKSAASEVGAEFADLFAAGISANQGSVIGALSALLDSAKEWLTGAELKLPIVATGVVYPPNAANAGTTSGNALAAFGEAFFDKLRAFFSGDSSTGGEKETTVNVNFTGDLAQLGRVLKPVIETENQRLGPSLLVKGYTK